MSVGTYAQVLIVTPNATDAELALSFLAERGIEGRACAGLQQLCALLPGGPGCVVLAEEALVESELPMVHDALAAQPAWADVPLILIAAEGSALEAMAGRAFPHSGNITLLERPLNPLTLVSAVHVGLRATARQLEVRDLLVQREAALHHRDEFLAMLAHELRNPLASIRNAVYLQKNLRIDDRIFVKSRDVVGRQVTNLTRMVDDLLDVARLERGKMQLQRERMDLNAAVTAAVDACLPIIQAAGHRVRVSLAGEALRIDGDPVRIEQVITNLLTNAAKFTLDAGEIAVESRRDGETAVVSVRDSGIGLQPEMIDAAFHPFTQGEETLARTGGGLGIGLTIARRLTELHGGAMEARSEGKHKGSTFLIRVPLVAAGVSAPAVQASAGRDAKRRRVLIVEDNADIRESLRMMVDLWGHEVLTAECGREGVAMADRERPEIALIDIGLPGMSGYEVAQAIRGMSMKDGALPIKLIAVTGYGQPSDKQRSLESGFNAHLLKPVDPHALQLILSEGAIAGA